MDLSYEETMKRIREGAEDDRKKGLEYRYCTSVKYPYHVNVYKGENKIIISPLITTAGWYLTDMAWHKVIYETNDPKVIGEAVFETFEHISQSWVDARTPKEREEDSFYKVCTKHKTYSSFKRKYLHCVVLLNEDGTFLVVQTETENHYKTYGKDTADEILVNMPSDSSQEDVGKEIVKAFEAMEKITRKSVSCRIKTDVIKTLSGDKFLYDIPDKKRYADSEDFHAAEIYREYSYFPKNSEESTADMYFGMAAELDCVVTYDSLRDAFTDYYGNVTGMTFSRLSNDLFDYYADITGDSYRKISYIKIIDDAELLSCELLLNTKRLRSATVIKTINDFEKMVKSCKKIH